MGNKSSSIDDNAPKMRDHYEVLDVPITASNDDIKKAYKKAALKWHPDRNHGQEELATEMFKEVLQYNHHHHHHHHHHHNSLIFVKGFSCL